MQFSSSHSTMYNEINNNKRDTFGLSRKEVHGTNMQCTMLECARLVLSCERQNYIEQAEAQLLYG